MKRLVMKDEIFLKIQIDVALRKKIAELDSVHHMSIRKRCIAKSPRMIDPNVIAVIKKHTGWTDKEIYKQSE